MMKSFMISHQTTLKNVNGLQYTNSTNMSDKLLNYATQVLKLHAHKTRVAKDNGNFPLRMTDSYTRDHIIKPFGYLYYVMQNSPLFLAKSDEAVAEVRSLMFGVLERCGIKRIKNRKSLKKKSNPIWDEMFSRTTPFRYISILQKYAKCRGIEEYTKWLKACVMWGMELQIIAEEARKKLHEERRKKQDNV